MRRVVLLFLLASAFPVLLSRSVFAVEYRIRDLGTLGGTYTQGEAINNCGEVVGRADVPSSGLQGFYWSESSGMTAVPPIPGCYGRSEVYDINDSGVMVGSSDADPSEASVWYPDGTTANLGEGLAVGMNNSGQVVGLTGIWRTWVWSQSTGKIDIGTLGGSDCKGSHINDLGEIVGESHNSAGLLRAFWWRPGTGMTELDILPGYKTHASAVNNHGQIAGAYNLKSGVHAFLWSQDAGVIELGTFGGSANYSVASDINDAGQIVGSSRDYYNRQRAFVWSAATGMVDLGVLPGMRESIATGINDNGVIVGSSFGSTSHAVIWEPVPEPSSLLALIAGIGGLSALAIRRQSRLTQGAPIEPKNGG